MMFNVGSAIEQFREADGQLWGVASLRLHTSDCDALGLGAAFGVAHAYRCSIEVDTACHSAACHIGEVPRYGE